MAPIGNRADPERIAPALASSTKGNTMSRTIHHRDRRDALKIVRKSPRRQGTRRAVVALAVREG